MNENGVLMENTSINGVATINTDMTINGKTVIKAVLFDLDGTLIDTEKYYKIVWPEAIRHFGFEPDPDIALHLRSLGRPFAPEFFRDTFGESFDYLEVKEYRKKLMEDMIEREGIALKDGAVDILEWLKMNKIPAALCTSNDYERSKRYLEKIGIFEYFDRIICATMVKYGKPAPDVYEFACRELGLAPENVMAVEDSPNGVKSAADAGCKVVMVPDLTEPDENMKGMLYARVDSLSDIKSLF